MTRWTLTSLFLLTGALVLRAEEQLPAARSWKFDWTADGKLASRTDPAGRRAIHAYDEQGRLKSVRFGDGLAATYAYDAAGRRDSVTSSDWGQTRFEYDAFNMPRRVAPPHGPAVDYKFDLSGRLRKVEIGDWRVESSYDLMGRLAVVESPLGRVTFDYSPANRQDGRAAPQTRRQLPNGVETIWTFAPDGRLVELRHESRGQAIIGWKYRYDLAGRIASITDLTGVDSVYSYDGLARLLTVTRNGRVDEQYDYDAGGNQVKSRRGDRTVRYGYDALSRPVGAGDERLAFNAAGEMILREGGGKSRRFDYDSDGKLRSVSGERDAVRYFYDADGNLAERRVGPAIERFSYDVSGPVPQLLGVTDGAERAVARYLLAPNRLAVQGSDGTVHWLLEDHLGSVRAIVDAKGKEAAKLDYSAFGAVDGLPSTAANVGFAGEWRDPATGLIYLRARWYDPADGRFLTPDLRWGKVEDPTSWNRYAYAGNSPVNAIDPTGQVPWNPPPPPSPMADLEQIRRINQMAAAAKVFPAAAKPLDFSFLRPDFIKFEVDVPGFRIFSMSAAFDRYGQFHPGLSMGYDKGYSPVQIGLYHVQGAPMSAAELKGFIRNADSSTISVLGFDRMRLQGRQAVGWNFGSYVSVSRDVDKLAPNLGALLEKLRPAPSKSDYPTAHAATLAAALARSPYKLYSKEHGEAKMAAYYEAAARAGPNNRGKVWVDWVMDAHYISPEQASRGSMIPQSRLLSGGGPPAPKLGGVHLNAIADVLGEFGALRSVAYDRENNRLLLLGDGQPVAARFRADHLAVALRAVAAGEWPGFSIDPKPGDPEGKEMVCRYIGPTDGTHLGMVMYVADRLLKDLSRGEDEHGKKLRPKAAGFKDGFELHFEHQKGPPDPDPAKRRWVRSWFVPLKVEMKTDPDGRLLRCTTAKIGVKAQVCRINERGEMEDVEGETDPAAEAAAKFLTDHYDELAVEYPVLEELRQLTQVVGFAAWLQKQLPPENFSELASSLSPPFVATPKVTPGTWLERKNPNGAAVLRRYGGVDLRPDREAEPAKDPALAEVMKAASAALPAAPRPTASEVRVGPDRYRAVAVPLVAPSAAGGLTLQSLDLSPPGDDAGGLTLMRSYNSTRIEAGPFGRGWGLLLPEIEVRGQGEKKQWFLTDSWGSFERPVQPPTLAGRIEKNHYVVESVDGTLLAFDRHRKLVLHRNGDTDWEYGYEEQSGRLRRIVVNRRKKTVAQIDLAYNTDGRIESATAGDRIARYEYDNRDRLIKVAIGAESLKYAYDDNDHLTAVEDSSGVTTYSCAKDGQLISGPDRGDRKSAYRREPLPDGGTRIVSDGPSPFEMVLDARQRLAKATQDGVTLQLREENDAKFSEITAGDVPLAKVTERKENGRKSLQVELPDGWTEQYVLQPDGTMAGGVVKRGNESAQIAFDEQGRLKAISDPRGGAYVETSGPTFREVATPAGTYRHEREGKSKTTLTLPGGRTLTFGGSDNVPLDQIVLQSGKDTRVWKAEAPDRWRSSENGKPLTEVTHEKEGRVTEVKNLETGAAIATRYGPGGSVTTTGDGRQIQFRVDAQGRIREIREFPTGLPPIAIPLADLMGAAKVAERVQSVPAIK